MTAFVIHGRKLISVSHGVTRDQADKLMRAYVRTLDRNADGLHVELWDGPRMVGWRDYGHAWDRSNLEEAA